VIPYYKIKRKEGKKGGREGMRGREERRERKGGRKRKRRREKERRERKRKPALKTHEDASDPYPLSYPMSSSDSKYPEPHQRLFSKINFT
jgi:hypothetical protein